MKKVLVCLLLGLLVASVALVACAQPAGPPTTPAPVAKPSPSAPPPSPKVGWPKELYIGAPGGGEQIQTLTLADIMQRNVGLRVVTEPVGSTDEMIKRTALGDFDFTCRAPTDKVNLAVLAKPPFDGIPKDAFRWIANGQANASFTVVRADSGIKSYADMRGKRITAGGSYSPSWQSVFLRAMAVHGITEKDIFLMPMEKSEINITNLVEGKIDVALTAGGDPKVYLVEAMKSAKLRIIGMTDEELTGAIKGTTYISIFVPGGLYPEHDADIPTFGSGPGPIMVRKDLPDDLVYEMTKALYEHLDQIRAAHAAFKVFTTDHCANSAYLIIPAHPGAINYLTKAGLWSDKDVKRSDEILAKIKAQL